MGRKSPGAPALEQVKDGVQDLAGAVYLWAPSSSLLWSGKVRLEAELLRVRQVGMVFVSSRKAERRSLFHSPFIGQFLATIQRIEARGKAGYLVGAPALSRVRLALDG